ncbi:hypothetical protein [Lactococcus allomyrinae]|uniref:DUF3168 domain-containing protein n=1 Tax=Lactococcus allomyrinae TaxID=2419773 RepID=A0A387BHP3_9LACT|nr:hypothetical protein [Lactococcus allomyrinae]AYG01702.1 hypothetical protein D7I46_11945 [Lactococcus allomyrinae]
MTEYIDGNQTAQRLINLVTRAVNGLTDNNGKIKYPLAFAPEHHDSPGAWSYYDIGQQGRKVQSRRFTFNADDIDSTLTLHIFENPEKQGDLINNISIIDRAVYNGYSDLQGFAHDLSFRVVHDESGDLHAVINFKK